MSLFPGINVLAMIEPLLLAVAFCLFVRAKAYKSFPAFGVYLAMRLGVYAVLDVLLHAHRLGLVERHFAYQAYYYVFWIGYLLGASAAFLVIQEIFRHLTGPLPGLGRLGLVAFRWVTLTSILIAVVLAISPGEGKRDLLVAVTGGVMRCMSILELCLLAFIVLSMQTLRISVRSRDFGLALGLAMVAAAELFGTAFAFGHTTMTSVANYACQVVVTLSACLWVMYFAKSEAVSQPLILPVTSPLVRWNEIANALGHPPPQIALGSSSSEFFLQDVERAVDRVLEKNSMNSAS